MNIAVDRPLVMGAAVGYGAAQVAPFIVSLRRSGYTGDILLLVDRALARELGRAGHRGLILLETPVWLPLRFNWLRWRLTRKLLYGALVVPFLLPLWLLLRALTVAPLPVKARNGLRLALARRLYAPTELRYLVFLDFLRDSPYTRVLLSDVRDVLFQSDPFAALPVSGLAVGMEGPEQTLSREPWNAWALRTAYGRATLARLGAQRVSCCGVTYGDRAAMRTYLEHMAAQILALRFTAVLQPIDQALHNFVLWSDSLGEVRYLEQFASPLVTLHGVEARQLRLDERDRLVNADGGVISIVHQYDRWPELGPRLLRAACGSTPS